MNSCTVLEVLYLNMEFFNEGQHEHSMQYSQYATFFSHSRKTDLQGFFSIDK